jgi:hypothetical protein
MEWNLNIPKILHVYWGGGVMHHLRFMTIQSFMDQNPDWKIMFWYPKYPTTNMTWPSPEQKYQLSCKDVSFELKRLPITRTTIDFQYFGFDNTIPEVHKSDFIRLHLLSTFGGLWSDMDIFYFKPMSSLYFNTPEYRNIETFYCNHNYGHSVGFLMASRNNKFFNILMDIAGKAHNSKLYQSMGGRIFNAHFSTQESIEKYTPAMNISMDVVYAHDASSISEIFTQDKTKFTEKSIGLHWYGGDPIWKDFLERTNGGLVDMGNNVIGNLLRNGR